VQKRAGVLLGEASINKHSAKEFTRWRRQKEEVGWASASVRQPNAEGVRSEAPRGRGAAGAETSAEGARVEAP